MPFRLCGAKGQIDRPEEVLQKLNDFCEDECCEAQIINADMVFGRTHLLSAYEHAERAFNQGRQSSKSLINEIVLYASGERQISVAIKKMGVKKGSRRFCIIIVGEADINVLVRHLGFEKDDTVLEGDIGKLRTYGISNKEIGAVPQEKVFDLVLERVAMVDLLK